MDIATGKTTLHISRHWHAPEIAITVYRDGIAIETSIEDFCKAIVAEISHPWKTVTRGGLEKNVLAVLEATLNKIKESSTHV